MKKAMQSIGLMLLLMVGALFAADLVFRGTSRHADADPDALLARALLPYMRDGQAFALADAYPEPWETVQVVSGQTQIDPWAWRALRDYDANVSELGEGDQLLVFWRGGYIAHVVRLNRQLSGMPWFVPAEGAAQGGIIPREGAVFRTLFCGDADIAYYQCVQQEAEQAV